MTSFVPDSSALCSQTDAQLFFPEKGQSDQAKTARRICNACPLIEPCREYALTVAVYGFWGGTSERERQKIRRVRGIVPEPMTDDLAAGRVVVKGAGASLGRSHRCGTPAGYRWHHRHGEKPCTECSSAAARHKADWRRRMGKR